MTFEELKAFYRQQTGGAPRAPSGAPASEPGAARSTQGPSQAEVSQFFAAESRNETYTIITTGAIEEAFSHLEITAGLVYVHGGDVNGILSAAPGDCYIGRTKKFLTEVRLVDDQNLPYLIAETPKLEIQPARIYVNGTAGTKVTLIYR